MVVLVVDDQVSVVSAILSGVHWPCIGVDTVLKAYNTFEAKEVFRTKPVDVMLCDIEMPGQDGLQLLRWVRENDYDTECIFLTSHADFMYAKEALQLGSFDYILQPARYEDIEAALKRVILKIREKQSDRQYYTYGRMIAKDQSLLLDALLGKWLWGTGGSEKQLGADLEKLDIGLAATALFHCVQLHILGWGALYPNGNDALFRYGLQNIFAELAAAYGQQLILVKEDDDTFWALLFRPGSPDGPLQQEPLTHLLGRLTEACEIHYGCQLAAYTGGPIRFAMMPGHCAHLARLRGDNVAMTPGVIHMNSAKDKEAGRWMHHHQSRWQQQIAAGQAASVAAEIGDYLDSQAETGKLNADTLQQIYQEFIQLLYKALEGTNFLMDPILKLFPDREQYFHAYRSVSGMHTLIDTSMNALQALMGKERQAEDIMDRIIGYIHGNIERDIRRADVAEAVYVSSDYISHLFRKRMNLSFSEFVLGEKMKIAKALLRTTQLPIGVVAAKVGYENFSYFSKLYKRTFDVTPAAERKSAEET